MKHSKFSEQIEEAISNPTPLGVKLKQARALGLTATIRSVTSCLTISICCTRPALPSPYFHCYLLQCLSSATAGGWATLSLLPWLQARAEFRRPAHSQSLQVSVSLLTM